MCPVPDSRRRSAHLLALIFVLFASGIISAGLFYYRHSVKEFRAAAGRNLAGIAAAKIADLAQWRRERIGDGTVFHENAHFTGLVQYFFDHPHDTDARDRVRTWLSKVQSAYHYERLCLHDAAGVERLSVPDTPEMHAAIFPEKLSDVMRSGRVTFTDFNRNEHDQRIYLRVLVPIFSESESSSPLAVLVLRIDAEHYLYPLVQRWPVPSRTAESLLVRREGDQVVFLNDLRFREGSALTLRMPVADSCLPAAMAVSGKEGVVEGVDYRGVPVLACVRAIPDSPWFLVARIDQSEVYLPLRRGLWTMVGMVAALLIAAAAIMGHLWRRETAKYFLARYEAAEAMRRQEERYHRTLDTMMEGCQILGFDWRYLYVNDAAAAHAQRTREALLGRTIMECYPGIETTNMFADLRRCMEERIPQQLENEFHYPGGGSAWFELSIQPVPEGVFVLSVGITPRKRTQQEQEAAIEFLRLAGASEGSRDLLEKAVDFFRKQWGFEAVGVRLREGDDYPYYQTMGFSEDFVLLENSLCAHSSDGNLVRDGAGHPMLDCMCGNVIQGRFDSSQPFFTAGGSFWTNCTTELLATTTEAERKARTRNRCNGEGYESVALIPLRSGERCHGLLQLNDHRRGKFTPELLALFERLAAHLAVSLAKLHAEEKLRHLNDVLRAVRNVNQLIVHERDRDTLLRRACDILTETRGYRTAWLALRDDEGRLHGIAESGIRADFTKVRAQLERGDWPECCREVLAHPGIVVMHDTQVNCVNCPLAHTYRGTAALAGSLRHADRVYGVLVVALPIEVANDEEEQALFRELAGDISFALHGMETEEGREQAEERYHTLFEASADGILIADIESKRFKYANPAACSFLGYSGAELATMGVPDIHPEENLPHILAEFEAMAHGDVRLAADIPCQRKDGEIVFADINVANIVVDGVRCNAGFFRDITARKKATEERTRLESQLFRAQKMESIGRLAGGVAHDFNNLLMGIMNYVELCRDRIASDHPIREWLDEITSDAQRSANLTRQLLAFARKQTIAPEVLDLNEAIEGMLKMLRRLIGEDIDLVWRPQSNLWPVKLDPGQVDQILANLCVNARDAIGGVGKVTIETAVMTIDAEYCTEHVEAIPGAYAVLAVSDDGCGMDREMLGHVFEPFFTTKPVGEGTGLGLATVYGIVKQNEGFVNVYSEPGRGTTFRIYLPRFDGGNAESAKAEKATERIGGSETILLVEDEKSVRVTTALFLEQLGYTVLASERPDEALCQAAEYAELIHLLVTDVVMPGMSGRDLVMELKETHPEMKCLFISGYTANVIAHHGILDADVQFLAKPFSRTDIALKVRKVLDGDRKDTSTA